MSGMRQVSTLLAGRTLFNLSLVDPASTRTQSAGSPNCCAACLGAAFPGESPPAPRERRAEPISSCSSPPLVLLVLLLRWLGGSARSSRSRLAAASKNAASSAHLAGLRCRLAIGLSGARSFQPFLLVLLLRRLGGSARSSRSRLAAASKPFLLVLLLRWLGGSARSSRSRLAAASKPFLLVLLLRRLGGSARSSRPRLAAASKNAESSAHLAGLRCRLAIGLSSRSPQTRRRSPNHSVTESKRQVRVPSADATSADTTSD